MQNEKNELVSCIETIEFNVALLHGFLTALLVIVLIMAFLTYYPNVANDYPEVVTLMSLNVMGAIIALFNYATAGKLPHKGYNWGEYFLPIMAVPYLVCSICIVFPLLLWGDISLPMLSWRGVVLLLICGFISHLSSYAQVYQIKKH
jgi:hypothetical protein